ncbi:hypothetical protein CsSME_00004148 [Camellia sinensis var. sinensis]
MQTNQLRTPPRQSITSSFTAKTERPCSKLRCGRWDLRATKSRQTRGQLCTPRSLFNTPKAKRKRSPQPSVNSTTAENDCPYPMSSSRPNGGQPNNMYDPYSVDDDDVMDLHMVCQLRRDIPTRQPQCNCPYTGEQYIKFLLSGNPKSICEQLRMEVPTFVEFVKQIVCRNVVDWSNMRLSLEESLAMFLFICGQSLGTSNAGDRFQHSNETIHRHFVLMMWALGNLAPFVIQPPNMAVTHPKIRNDRRYWPWFKDCVGAIDGTHIVVVAPEGDRMPYRGRKVHTTQNVMATCSFDMKFTFVYIGWEGSAHDSRIFLEALTTNSADFPHPPPSKCICF